MRRMYWLTLVVAVAALLGALLVGNFMLWLVGAVIALAALWAWYWHDEAGSTRSQGLAAVLSAAALLFGVYWYMIERPGAAKLDIVIEGRGFSAGAGQALVLLSVDVRNVGNTPVRFRGEDRSGVTQAARQNLPPTPAAQAPPPDVDCLPESAEPAAAAAPGGSVMMIRVGKVVPLAAGLAARLACATHDGPDGPEVRLARADQWPPVARIDQNLVTRIEAGERERYFYRFVVACEDRLALAVTARIPKRATITDTLVQQEPTGYVWIGQTVIDLNDVCGT